MKQRVCLTFFANRRNLPARAYVSFFILTFSWRQRSNRKKKSLHVTLRRPERMKSGVRSPAFRWKRLASRNGSASDACGLKAGLRTDFPQEAVMKKGFVLSLLLPALISARQAQKVDQVELQPLTAQARRLIEAMDYLGAPIKQADREALEKASDEVDAAKARRGVQDALDKYCLF